MNQGRPSVCRNCGAIVSAGENVCPQCGAGLAGNAPSIGQQLRDGEAVRFARAILTRPAPFTFVFLTVNIFVFLLMTFSGGSENPEVLRVYGAKFNSLIDIGEWWRFVTPIFLHIGPIHILANMYGLWAIGPYVERLYGSAKFVVFWIVAGIAGVAASYLTVVPPGTDVGMLGRFLFKPLDGPSAGASGALFGLIGVLFVFGIKFRHELPEDFKRAFGTGMLPTILINLYIGYVFPFIDNSAHLGGLFAGALLALLVDYKRPGPRGRVAVAWHALQMGALMLVITSFAFVASNFTDVPPPGLPSAAQGREALSRLLTIGTQSVQTYLEAMSKGVQAFVTAFNKKDTSQVESALQELDRVPRFDETADALRNELKYLLVSARRLAEEQPADRAARLAQATERQKIFLSFESWQERYQLWLDLELPKYGLKVERKEPSANAPQNSGKLP